MMNRRTRRKTAGFCWLMALALSSCSSESPEQTDGSAPAGCSIAGTSVDCDLQSKYDALRPLTLHLDETMATDTAGYDYLIGVTDSLLELAATLNANKDQIPESGWKEIQVLLEDAERRQDIRDTLQYWKDLLQEIEVKTTGMQVSTTLSDGTNKYPIVSVINKSNKRFRKILVQFDILDRSGAKLHKIYHTITVNGFQPAGFGAEFPQYYRGENRKIYLAEDMTPEILNAWDSTAVTVKRLVWQK